MSYCKPADFGTYYAPFIGSGAVLAELAPRRALASDALAPLVGCDFTYSTATRKIILASTNSTWFQPVMVGDLANWLGFTQSISGYSTSCTAESTPAGVAELMGATRELVEDARRVDLHEYRHGRAASIVWGNHQLHRVRIYFDDVTREQIEIGYLTTGRIRIRGTMPRASEPDGEPQANAPRHLVA